MTYDYGKPEEFCVRYPNPKKLAALVKEHGHEDHDPALYWETRNFETKGAAVVWARHRPGGYVTQRYAFEQTAPGMWDWEEQPVPI